MTEPPPYRRRSGARALPLLVLLMVIGGLALGAYLLKRGPWRDTHPAPTQAVTKATVVPVIVTPPPAAANQPAAAAIDPDTLAAREAVLAGQLAALEARTASVASDAAGAAGQAGHAEALLAAFAARRVVDRGQPLGYLEPQLSQRFGGVQPRAVAIVIQGARQPVTLEELRQGLEGLSQTLVNGSGGWFAGLRRELAGLIVLRPANTPSSLPADRLARAERLLDSGQIEGAIAEVQRLPGADRAGNWLAAARRYAAVHHALDILEQSALALPLAPRPAPPLASAAPPAPTGVPEGPTTAVVSPLAAPAP